MKIDGKFLLLLCICLAVCASMPVMSDITKSYYNSDQGRWLTDTIATGSYTAVARRNTSYNSVFAARIGAFDLVQYDNAGGEYGWHAHNLNANTYTALTNDSTLQYVYGTRSGSLDCIYPGGGGWNTLQLNTNTYTCLTPNIFGNSERASGASIFAARQGGLDLVQYDSSGGWGWHTYNLNDINYTALAGECRPGQIYQTVFGARADGGLDLIQYNDYQGYSWKTIPLNDNNYVALTAESQTVYPYMTVYAARADGGLDIIQYNDKDGWSWKTIPISSNKYVALVSDPTPPPGSGIYCWLFGARADGGTDVIFYNGSWVTGPVNTNKYQSLTIDGTNAGWVYGVTASFVYNSANRPDFIHHATGINVDGVLDEWADAEWAPLDAYYDGDATDIIVDENNPANNSAYAAKWDSATNKVYLAVKVNDSAHSFTYIYDNWDARDAVELYLNTTGSSGDYSGLQQPAQEYTIGFRPDAQHSLWSAIGYGNPVPSSAEFQFAGTIDGTWLYYEAALTPFQFLGALSDPIQNNIVTQLKPGDIIGVDVVAAAHDGFTYTGMMAENYMTQKSSIISRFARHQLVGSLSKSALDGDLVSANDYVVTGTFDGLFYMESPSRTTGIRVNKASYVVEAGNVVSVIGFMRSDPVTGERYIDAEFGTVTDTLESFTINPLGMTNKSLGGADMDYAAGPPASGQVGVTGATGLNNIGLLVKTTGLVSNASGNTFTIEDGSGVAVQVVTSGSAPQDGQYVVVTGISSCRMNGADRERQILAVDWN